MPQTPSSPSCAQFLAREVGRPVPLGSLGRELFAREVAQHVADLFLFRT
jgi:hypothetical protein